MQKSGKHLPEENSSKNEIIRIPPTFRNPQLTQLNIVQIANDINNIFFFVFSKNGNSTTNLTSPNRFEYLRLNNNSANSLFQNNRMDNLSFVSNSSSHQSLRA